MHFEDYFTRVITSYGYDDIEVRYDLGFCQGSGVSFTSTAPDLHRIAKRMVLQEAQFATVADEAKSLRALSEWRRLVDSDVFAASIDSIDSRYAHECTVRANVEIEEGNIEDLVEDEGIEPGTDDFRNAVDDLSRDVEEKACELEEFLTEDVRSICSELKHEAEDLLLALGPSYGCDSQEPIASRLVGDGHYLRLYVLAREKMDDIEEGEALSEMMHIFGIESALAVRASIDWCRRREARCFVIQAQLQELDDEDDEPSLITAVNLGTYLHETKEDFAKTIDKDEFFERALELIEDETDIDLAMFKEKGEEQATAAVEASPSVHAIDAA